MSNTNNCGAENCRDRVNHIKCCVTNCTYHDGKECCHADMIEVGPNFAVSDNDTKCSTFKAK